MRARAWRRLAALVLAGLLAGCAGSRSSIVAWEASYPVSLSPMVRDPRGVVLGGDALEQVGEFSFEYRSTHMFFTLIPLARTHHDLSQAIDEQVQQAGGEAVVDLSVTAHHNDWTYFCVLLGFGILPAYSDVTVSGRIVRRPAADALPSETPEAPSTTLESRWRGSRPPDPRSR